MSGWKAKRFWKSAAAVAVDGGWGVTLDDRRVMTPAKAPLVVPSRALAEGIAAEWAAQEGEVDPLTMPLTRSANAALDKVRPQFDEVADLIAAYGETDLCCYRAGTPKALAALQAEAWDPLLDWLAQRHGARLSTTVGIVPVAQSADCAILLRARVAATDPFALTALHDLVALSGSLVIGLAALEDHMPAEELWRRSRIDETWQESQWGVDAEAAAEAARKRDAFLHAACFYRLSRPEA